MTVYLRLDIIHLQYMVLSARLVSVAHLIADEKVMLPWTAVFLWRQHTVLFGLLQDLYLGMMKQQQLLSKSGWCVK